MKPISDRPAFLSLHGANVSPRARSALATNDVEAFELMIDTQAAFMDLIWHSLRGKTDVLTPPNATRTLADVAGRALNHGVGAVWSSHSWFDPCSQMYDIFDPARVVLGLVMPSEDERRDSPSGTFYIHDAAHRSLVYAIHVMAGTRIWAPVHAVLLTPRDRLP